MIRKSALYSATRTVWALLVIGAGVGIYLGVTEPFLSPSTIPGPAWTPVAAAVVVATVGWWAVGILETRSWVSAGRRADLAASGGGIVRTPELTGEVRGRGVRAYTREKKGGGGQGSSKQTYTVVEADLAESPETGILIARADGSAMASIDAAGGDGRVHREGGYAGVGESATLVTQVLTGPISRKLDQVSRLEFVTVGDASAVLPDTGSGLLGSLVESGFMLALPGDGSTVATETRGVVLDGDELRARVDAVAAVADAFEDATTSDEWGR